VHVFRVKVYVPMTKKFCKLLGDILTSFKNILTLTNLIIIKFFNNYKIYLLINGLILLFAYYKETMLDSMSFSLKNWLQSA
jgi:hypothetical protein